MNKEYFNLLKTWCDRMTELQLDGKYGEEFRGGLLCPGCGYIHGRIADAVYPMVTMYSITKDEKYIKSAEALFDWTIYNMERPDGLNFNDSYSAWKGISVFFAVSLLQSIYYHADCIPDKFYKKIEAKLRKLLNASYDFVMGLKNPPAINYPIFLMAEYSLAYKIFGDEKYKITAEKAKENAKSFITPEYFIYGEPKSVHTVSPKGGYLVDIGYNVEESISAFTIYGEVMEDREITELALKIAKAHKYFLLSDGALDNSAGSRSPKWSYWGSRTSDGCQESFCTLSKYDPDFGEYAERNFELYKKCNVNGLLAGGLHYKQAGELPCIHLTFCHAKAIAFMIDSDFEYKPTRPDVWYTDYSKRFSDLNVTVINRGEFRATVSDFDCDLSGTGYINTVPSGGSLTLLHSKRAGAIFAASMPNYATVEPTNMQYTKSLESRCQTLRIESLDSDTRSDMDFTTCISQSDDGYTITATGNLSNRHHKIGAGYSFTYRILPEEVIITAECEEKARLYLPLVASSDEMVTNSKNRIEIQKENCTVVAQSQAEIKNLLSENERNFNHCGGFQTYYAYADMNGEKVTVSIKVKG